MKHIVIIGAGFGGLSAAAYAAKAGYKVTVLEKNRSPGGRAMVRKTKGFIFDLGPSWYMMPDIFDDFFDDFGKKTSDYYKLIQLDPSYKVFTKKNSYDVRAVNNKGLDVFDSIDQGSSTQLKKLLKKTKAEYELVRENLLENTYQSPAELLNTSAIKMAANPQLLRSYHSRIARYIKNNDIQKILEFMVVFMGGSPHNIPALYSLLTHVDLGLGIWYPIGGFGSVVDGFEKLGIELGVEYVYNANVESINVVNSKVTGVQVNGSTIVCDAVIANADYHHVETKLLDQANRSYSNKYWDNKILSPSGFMLYLGVDKKIPNLKHHTLFFDSDWDKHFTQVFTDKSWSESPLFYIGCPSKTDNSVAPKNNENIFVLAPIANGITGTKKQKDQLINNIISRIEQKTKTDFKNNIVVKEVRDIEYFEQTFNAFKGNAFGLAHTLQQSALLRPNLKSKKVKNLFYTGHYTNPGTGVPMVVLSGKLAAKLAIENA